MVWIHGGAFQNGVGAFQFHKPEYFIDHNIVVVTINYRLGPLGKVVLKKMDTIS